MPSMRIGRLAADAGYRLQLEVLESANGFYLGTMDQEGPVSRESMEYFPTRQAADKALESGQWTQRDHS